MERIGFCMRLLPGAESEYRERHEHVWPELLADLRAAGAGNYSIFIRGSDLFAYLEVEDFARFTEQMSHSEANERWQAEMASLIDPLTDPATGFHQRVEEVFHLD
jgi:L-rhamnose mutarotase